MGKTFTALAILAILVVMAATAVLAVFAAGDTPTATIAFSVGKDTAGNTVTADPTSGATFQARQVSGDYTAAGAVAATARHKRRTT